MLVGDDLIETTKVNDPAFSPCRAEWQFPTLFYRIYRQFGKLK